MPAVKVLGFLSLLTVVLAYSPPAAAQEPAPGFDLFGAPLPDRVVARMESARLRLQKNGNINQVAISPDGKLLVCATYQGEIVRFDPATGEQLPCLPQSMTGRGPLAFSADGKRLATPATARRGGVKVYDPATGKELLHVKTHEDIIWALAFSPDGKSLAVADRSPNIRLRNTAGKPVARFTGHTDEITALAFSADGKFVAGGDAYYRTSNAEGRLHVWEFATGKLLHVIHGHGNFIRSVAFSPDSKTVATGSDGVRLWDVSTGAQVRRFPHGRFIDAIAFTPDGGTIAASGNGAVVWEVATGKELLRPTAGNYVSGLAISPDGKLLATGGNDKLVRLWDLATGSTLVEFAGHLEIVNVLAFSRDGKRLASGSTDTTILIWDVPTALVWARNKAKQGPALANLDALWADLARADAAAAHKATWAMAAEPARTVAYLKDHLKPPDRDTDDFVVPPGDSLRHHRAIEILERIGTPEAKALLDKLARRAASRWSREASAALRRLDQLRPAPIKPRLEPTEAERLEQLWRDLGEADAVAGHKAIWGLIGEPEHATALLKARLKPAEKPEKDATLLVPAGAALRAVRAVAVLEHIASDDARKLLEVLAAGPPARLTREATAALDRLKQRK